MGGVEKEDARMEWWLAKKQGGGQVVEKERTQFTLEYLVVILKYLVVLVKFVKYVI